MCVIEEHYRVKPIMTTGPQFFFFTVLARHTYALVWERRLSIILIHCRQTAAVGTHGLVLPVMQYICMQNRVQYKCIN